MSETEKKTPPVAPKGWRHVDPPTYARPKAFQSCINWRGLPVTRQTHHYIRQDVDHGRRWIIEGEPAIGGHDDAKAHEWARTRGMRVVGYHPVNRGEQYIGWSFPGSGKQWEDFASYEKYGAFTKSHVYIVAPLADAVVEPVPEIVNLGPGESVQSTVAAPPSTLIEAKQVGNYEGAETWVTMRLREVEKLQEQIKTENQNFRVVEGVLDSTRAALEVPEAHSITEWAKDLKRGHREQQATIASLRDELEKARHEIRAQTEIHRAQGAIELAERVIDDLRGYADQLAEAKHNTKRAKAEAAQKLRSAA